MKKTSKKVIIFLLFFSLIPFCFILAQGRELEVKYPAVEGVKPETIDFPLAEYVKYIFNIVIVFAGIVGLFALIIGGVLYLTSTGKPENLEKAKKQILAAFLGLIILLASYLILITINPQLTIFQFPGLPEIPSTELPATPISPLITADLLGRIKQIAENIKEIPNEIKSMAEKIQELTNKCDCQRTLPLCMCTGGEEDAECQPRQCYAGPPSDPATPDSHHHPCQEFKEIKDNQKRIIAWKDEILYYRNRAISENEDLKDEIEKILENKIEWYENKITMETEEEIIAHLEEEKNWLIYEKDYKEDLEQKLKELADAIAKVETPVNEISQLPDECLYATEDYGVNNKCNASCKSGEGYGCHDDKQGCQPDKCSGGNPCPIDEIQNKVSEITPLPDEIIRICDEIISLIDNIEKVRAREVQI